MLTLIILFVFPDPSLNGGDTFVFVIKSLVTKIVLNYLAATLPSLDQTRHREETNELITDTHVPVFVSWLDLLINLGHVWVSYWAFYTNILLTNLLAL